MIISTDESSGSDTLHKKKTSATSRRFPNHVDSNDSEDSVSDIEAPKLTQRSLGEEKKRLAKPAEIAEEVENRPSVSRRKGKQNEECSNQPTPPTTPDSDDSEQFESRLASLESKIEALTRNRVSTPDNTSDGSPDLTSGSSVNSEKRQSPDKTKPWSGQEDIHGSRSESDESLSSRHHRRPRDIARPASLQPRRSCVDNVKTAKQSSGSHPRRVQFTSPEVSSSSSAVEDYDRTSVPPNYAALFESLEDKLREKFADLDLSAFDELDPDSSPDGPNFFDPETPSGHGFSEATPAWVLSPERINELFNRSPDQEEYDTCALDSEPSGSGSNFVGEEPWMKLHSYEAATHHQRTDSFSERKEGPDRIWYTDSELARRKAESDARLMAAAGVNRNDDWRFPSNMFPDCEHPALDPAPPKLYTTKPLPSREIVEVDSEEEKKIESARHRASNL
jgi:hypothetical protein